MPTPYPPLIAAFLQLDPEGRDLPLSHPHADTWQGEPCTVATTGHRMLILQGDPVGGPVEGYLKWAKAVPDYHAWPHADVPLADLRAFLGLHDPASPGHCPECAGSGRQEDPCDACDGVGTHACICSGCGNEHDVDCEECGAVGWIPCPACAGDPPGPATSICCVRIAGALMDRQNVRAAVRHLPGETVRMYAPAEGSHARGRHLVLEGEGSIVVLAGVADTEVTIPNAPLPHHLDAPRFDWPES